MVKTVTTTMGDDKLRKAKSLWKLCNALRRSESMGDFNRLRHAADLIELEAKELCRVVGHDYANICDYDSSVDETLPNTTEVAFIANH